MLTGRGNGVVAGKEAPTEEGCRSAVAQGAPPLRRVVLENGELREHNPPALPYGGCPTARTPPATRKVSLELSGVFECHLGGG